MASLPVITVKQKQIEPVYDPSKLETLRVRSREVDEARSTSLSDQYTLVTMQPLLGQRVPQLDIYDI